jgi:molybdate transport system substrate-binding protein
VLKIITSGVFASVLEKILPLFAQKNNIIYELSYGSSFGEAKDSIPSRIKNNEHFDIYFLAEGAINRHHDEGILDIKTKHNIVSSEIGVAVKNGSKLQDISSLKSFKETLISAKSIGYAASASGIYLANTVFPKIFNDPDLIFKKSKKILSERVGSVIFRGDIEIGFQQYSELLPIKGIKIIGMLPKEIRKSFIFGSAMSNNSTSGLIYRNLIKFIKHDDTQKFIKNSGLKIL